MAVRIDKYLKLARLVKRRVVAQEMVDVGAVRIGGRRVKPSSEVKNGDVVEVAFPKRLLKVQVLLDEESDLKRRGAEPYRLLGDDRIDPEDRLWNQGEP